MKVLNIKIGTIKPYENNPRLNDPAVKAVKASIQRWGYNVPIVVDKKNVIICGDTRYRALLELGWDKVKVIQADLSPELAKEFRIVDNKTAEVAEWDQLLLIDELRGLEKLNETMADIFGPTELERLMKKISSTATTPVSGADIVETTRRTRAAFKDKSDQRSDAMQELKCQHCGRSFFIKKEE